MLTDMMATHGVVKVHDTVLDFLISKSTEENFCTMLSNPSKPESRVRRLSLMGDEDQTSVEQLDLTHARSLGAFVYSGEYFPSLVKSNALRVLDLQDCWRFRNHHVKDMGRFFQLRYLNISRTHINELPRQIGDLEYLETLNASYTRIVELPESVTRLKRLARLFVREETKLPDGIGNMKKLQELWDINPFKQSVNFVKELGKLNNPRKLRIIWESDGSDKASSMEKMLVSSLSKLDTCRLANLRITFDLTERNATLEAHPFFPALNSILEVHLRRGKLRWIATWLLSITNRLISVVNVEILYISCAEEIEQQDVEMVGSIPTLVELQLNTCSAGPITIISGGFRQLQKLALNFCVTELMFEAGAMPNLRKLDLRIDLRNFKTAGGGDGGFDIGIQHLSNIAWVHVEMICRDVKAADVKCAEGAFKSVADAHPNRSTLEFTSKACAPPPSSHTTELPSRRTLRPSQQ